jgi:alpha-N-arabinofuranosidase
MKQPGIIYFDRISVHSTAEGSTRADTLAAMRELAIPDLRWPSGCTSTGYHWRRGAGPEDERHDDADPVFHWGINYRWGTDEYLELCSALGIRPHLIANVGTGTPREAAEWAAYCADWYRQRGMELPEMVWQVGNEHYGTHEIGHMSGEQYAACLAEFAPGIRRNYPRAIICTTSLGEKPLEYVKPLLATAREHADMIPVHHYACRVDFNPAREALAFVGDAHAYGRGLDELAAVVAEAGSHAALAVTEWGAFRGETHTDAKFCEPVDAGRMLFVTAMLNEYARRGGVLKLANFYSLVNFMPAIIARGPHIERTLKHEIFRFWRPLFPAMIQEVTVEGPVFSPPESKNDQTEVEPDLRDGSFVGEATDGSRAGRPDVLLPWIDALAGTNDAGAWLLLTNRHPTETLTVQLPPEYAGATVDRLLPSADHLRFEGKDGAESAAATLTLPPWSHARLRCPARQG